MECDNRYGAQSFRKYDHFGLYYNLYYILGSYEVCTALSFEAVIFGVVIPRRLGSGYESWEEYGTRVSQPRRSLFS
jgi:hypothetical protein